MIAIDALMHPEPSKLRVVAANLRRAASIFAILTVVGASQAIADAYTDLDDAGKSYVKRICMPVQYTQDTAAFRQCVVEHANALLAAPAETLAKLNVDQRIANQRACSSLAGEGSAAGLDCDPGQIETTQNQTPVVAVESEPASGGTAAANILSSTPTAPLPAAALPTQTPAALSAAESLADSVEQTTSAALETVTGDDAADIAVEAVAIPATPAVPRTPTTISDSVQTVTSESVPDEALTRENIGATVQVSDTDNINLVVAQNTVQSDAEPVAPAVSANQPDALESSSDDINSEGFTESEAPIDVAKRLWGQLLGSVEGVSGINRVILIAAAALPFLLIIFWLLMRGRKKEPEYIPPPHPSALRDRVRAYPDDELDDTLDTAADHSVASQQMYEDQVNELFSDESDPVLNDDIDETVAISPSVASSIAAVDAAMDEDHSPELEASTNQNTKAGDDTGMMSWLSSLDDDEQLSSAIEFMIYWMAYTDERYQPELKKSVFEIDDPDEHDLIKRRVLSQDTAAFAQTTTWLQENTSADQRVQILKLLMALLVNEEALTPVQNTMLRFLSNAFGMGHEQLDELFQDAFAESLPPMPRPDKPSWWEQQPTDKQKRWDARSVAQQSQSIQSRVKLGLPLSGGFEPEVLEEKYHRAIARCQPERFDLLTEREQLLAEQQQYKFDTAFDILKEVSA